jgi:hypothetical protein
MTIVSHKYAKPAKVLERRRENGVTILKLAKIQTDEWMADQAGRFFDEPFFPIVAKEDTDVYTEDGELLIRFRKNVLPLEHIASALEAVGKFSQNATTERGIASGNKSDKKVSMDGVMSNIIGYFDKFCIAERGMFKRHGIKALTSNKLTKFTRDHPDLMEKIVPLIQDIDQQYKELVPGPYKKQYAMANKTDFRIKGTAFSTVSTNLNFRTALHKDAGDFEEGFGNLVVVENGKYTGAYTGFPQWGVAVDARTGDFVAMDVHQWHANTAIKQTAKVPYRLSFVSYFRENIVLNNPDDTLEKYYKSMAQLKQAIEKSRK